MALGKCPDCGGAVSLTAGSCPRRGCASFSQATGKTLEVACPICSGIGHCTAQPSVGDMVQGFDQPWSYPCPHATGMDDSHPPNTETFATDEAPLASY